MNYFYYYDDVTVVKVYAKNRYGNKEFVRFVLSVVTILVR